MKNDKRVAELKRLAQEQREDKELEEEMMLSLDDSDDLEEEGAGGVAIDKDDVLDFFRENNNPSDEDVHAFAEELGYDPEELEEVIYELVTEYVKILDDEEDAEYDFGGDALDDDDDTSLPGF